MASFFDIKPKAAAPAPGGASADDVKGAVKALKALAPVTGPDPNRGALCCVCVQERGGVPYAVATDRAVKGLMEVPGVQCGTYPLGIAPYVMGDPGNSTTARVWQDGDLLALVMPVRVSEEDYYVTTTRTGVDNFFNGGSND